jgi:O-antigen/teichoic acid export membrane protein
VHSFFQRVVNSPARAATIAGWYQQACSILGTIIALPVILNVLGAADAGLWFSFQAILTFVSLTDFGFSAAITRQVAHSLALDESRYTLNATDLIATTAGWAGVSDVVSASKYIFARVTIVGLFILVALHEVVLPATRLAPARTDSTFEWYVLGAATLVTFHVRRSQSVLDGIGWMFLGRLISGTCQLASYLGCVVVLSSGARLPGMAMVLLAASVVQFAAMELALFRITRSRLQRTDADRALAKRLLRVAVPFGLVSSGGFLVEAIQIPLLGALLGPEVVAAYYVAARINQTLHGTVAQMTTSQLPIFTHMCARGDTRMALERFKMTFMLGVAMYLGCSAFLLFASSEVVSLWLGPGHYVERDTLFVLGCASLLSGATGVPGYFVLAAGSNPFALTTLLHGVFTVLAVLLLVPRMGVVAIPLSSVVAGSLTNYWYMSLKGWRLWKRLRSASTV